MVGEENFEYGDGIGAGILDALTGAEVGAFVVHLAVMMIPAAEVVSAGMTHECIEDFERVGKIGVIHGRRRFPILPQ